MATETSDAVALCSSRFARDDRDSPPRGTRHERILRDGLINHAGVFISGVTGVIVIPVMLRNLGSEAYGLWVSMLAVLGAAGILSPGLEWAVTAEVAAGRDISGSDDARRVVTATWNLYLLLGAAGALTIAVLGPSVSRGLHLSAETQRIAPAVFVMGATMYFSNRMSSVLVAVFDGLLRFDLANILAAVSALVEAVGAIALLSAGARLTIVAGWEAAIAVATVLAALQLTKTAAPQFLPTLQWPDFDRLRHNIKFGLASQLTSGVNTLIWEIAPLLIGFILGSAWVVPYHVGRRFPMAVASVAWSFAGVLFPAASEEGSKADPNGRVELIESATRWLILLAFPGCLTLWVTAPALLHAWLGVVPRNSVEILRLFTVIALVGSLGWPALQVLWGGGRIRKLLTLLSLVAAGSLILTSVLIAAGGVVGAAWALLIALSLGSVLLIREACRDCGVGIRELVSRLMSGLPFPMVTAAATAVSTAFLIGPGGWIGIGAVGICAALAFTVCLCAIRANERERAVVFSTLAVLGSIFNECYLGARRRLARLGLARV